MALACLAQLDRSHRRHDDVMSQLLDAARRLAAGRPHDSDVDAVKHAVAYFERSVTRHFLDEEGSVFPRLSTRRPELAEALAALSAEHPAQVALQNAVAEHAKQLDGDHPMGVGKALLEVAEKLAEQHRKHVENEDGIFAAAADALTEQDDAEIVAEMETRRDRETEDSGAHRAPRMGGGGGGGGGRNRNQHPRAQTEPATPIAMATKPAAKKAAKPAAKKAAKPAKKPAAKSAKTTKAAAKTAKAKPAAKKSPGKKKPAGKKR